ncbi:MAG: SUMF1/EgtB/PvdO family nonheme iron enzyme, partial [Calditrichia bacterium]|nr:SUMF1/EgtB/PvdO family nonheme iron enzyme [Calditrichia bacterium]
DKSEPGTTTVGSYPSNKLGLYDLGGNVHEWVFDFYDSTYYQNSPQKNPKGPLTGKFKVERGGSWRSPIETSRCSNRHYAKPDFKINNIGFRLCVSNN